MLLTSKPTLKDQLVRIICDEPGIKTSALRKKIESRGRTITRPGLYKALNQLNTSEVLVKVGPHWYINIRWLSSVGQWVSQSEILQVPHFVETNILPTKVRERRTFNFGSAVEMDAFWGHLLIALTRQSKSPQVIYAYNPHFWFYLVHGLSEQQYASTIAKDNVKTKMLIGSQSALDRWNTALGVPNTSWYFYPVSLYEKNVHQAFNSVGDYFLTISYDKHMAYELHLLFEKTQSLSELDHGKLSQLLNTFPCSIAVSKKPAKQKTFVKKLDKLFGELRHVN